MQLNSDSTPEQIRKYIFKIGGIKNLVNDDGEYVSPITGKVFPDLSSLSGHIGAHIRQRPELTKLTPDRAGYVKAIRRGMEPTDEQRTAHRNYMRRLRDGTETN